MGLKAERIEFCSVDPVVPKKYPFIWKSHPGGYNLVVRRTASLMLKTRYGQQAWKGGQSSIAPHGTLRRMRKPKTGRTAGRQAEHSPTSLIWTKEICAAIAAQLFQYIEHNHGSDEAKRAWANAARKPRERSLKAPSDADLALVRRFLGEREKSVEAGEYPHPTDRTLARRVAQSLTPPEARALGINTHAVGDDFHRAVINAVLRRVKLYEKTADGHRAAMDVPDPLDIVLNIDRPPTRSK